MLFDKRPKFENLNWTDRKIKSIQSRPKRQQEKLQEKYPLLANQIQPPAAINIDDELICREVMATQIVDLHRTLVTLLSSLMEWPKPKDRDSKKMKVLCMLASLHVFQAKIYCRFKINLLFIQK